MKRFFLIIILISIFTGCTLCSTKKINCPAFEDSNFDQWFPYTQNQMLLFKGPNAADTLNLVMQTISASTGYETTQGGYSGGSSFCMSSKRVLATSMTNFNDFLSVSYSKEESFNAGGLFSSRLLLNISRSEWVVQKLNNNSLSAYENNEYNIVDSSYNVNFSNGINYPVLATITNDTLLNKTSKYYKLFIAKGFGIIGFDEYPSNKRWVVQ